MKNDKPDAENRDSQAFHEHHNNKKETKHTATGASVSADDLSLAGTGSFFENFLNTLGIAIYPGEWLKFLHLCSMMSLLVGSYTMLRILKDSLLVDTPGGSVSAIVVVKILVIPASIVFSFFYQKLISSLKEKPFAAYAATASIFGVFFFFFSTVLFPLRDVLQSSPEWARSMQIAFPIFSTVLGLTSNWLYVLFYLMAELSGSVLISILFWDAVNQYTSKDEAARMYPLVNIPSNLFSAAAAAVVAIVTRQATSVVATAAVTEVNSTFVYGFTGCCLAVSAMLFMVVFLYYQLQTNYNSTSDNKTAKKKKPKISLSYIESLKIIWNDRCLLSLSLMTFFYGLCLNVIEVQWKDSLKLWSGANYTSNYSQFFLYSNIFSALITALTRNTLSRYGWKISALVTPVSILITGSLFYIFLMINNIGGGYFANLIISPLLISVMVGGLQNMISKATKYTLFDSTRELAYKTLPRENQSIGKSIIDVVIGRSSKASGSAVQYSLMNYMVPFIIGSNVPVSLRAIVPYSFVIVLIGCITWISATLYLAHQYENTDPSETAKLTPFSSVIDYYQTKMLLSPDDASIKAEFKTIYDTYYAEAAASQFEKVKKLAAIHHHQEELKNNL